MLFDPNSRVIQLCSQGMQIEGELRPAEAKLLFVRAWEEAANDFEKLVAAHYVARHQDYVEDKLKWDELALSFAMKLHEADVKTYLPSLYLNIAKCHEDMGNWDRAREYYGFAGACVENLPANGYGHMIKAGIKAGISRISDNLF